MMKTGIYSISLLILTLALAGCEPNKPVPPTPIPATPPQEQGILSVTLIPEWEGQPMERFVEYRNFMDYRTTVEMLKLYWGDVRFVDGMDTTMVKDVDLFDLGNGPTTKQWSVPVGSWTSLRAALAVPDDLNNADPANYPSGHPLSVSNGTYWTWATGYRYVLFEGRYNTDPASTDVLTTSYAIHPGMAPSYKEFDLVPANGITITKDQTTEIVVRIAVDRFFHSAEDQIDLATENTAHGTNVPLQVKLVNNVIRSMELQ